jgi:hypothetical protein
VRAMRSVLVLATLLVILTSVSTVVATHRAVMANHRAAAHAAFVRHVAALSTRLGQDLRLHSPDGRAGFTEAAAYFKFAEDLNQTEAMGADKPILQMLIRSAALASVDYSPDCGPEPESPCYISTWPTASRKAAARDAAEVDHLLNVLLGSRRPKGQ